MAKDKPRKKEMQFHLRLSKDQHSILKAQALRDRRTLTNYLQILIDDSLAAKEKSNGRN